MRAGVLQLRVGQVGLVVAGILALVTVTVLREAREQLVRSRILATEESVHPWQATRRVHKLSGEARLDTEFVADPYAPYTEDPAIYAKYRSSMLMGGSFTRPFLLEGNGTSLFVNPASAAVHLDGTGRDRVTVRDGWQPPRRIQEFHDRNSALVGGNWEANSKNRDRHWFVQEYVPPGDRLTVYGEVTPLDEADVTDDAREVLRQRGVDSVVESGGERNLFVVYNGDVDEIVRGWRRSGVVWLIVGSVLAVLSGWLLVATL